MLTRTTLTRLILGALAIVILLVLAVFVSRYPTVSVPALNANVKAGQTITDTQIVYVNVPANVLFGSLIQNKADVVGKQTAVNISADEPLKRDEFAQSAGSDIPNLDPNFPYATQEDLAKQKYSLPTDLAHASGGLIKPGDYVTIMLQANGHAQYVLQKIHVIAAQAADGSPVNGPNGPSGLLTTTTQQQARSIAYVILALTPSQATMIGSLDWHTLFLSYAALTDPDLPGVDSGAPATLQGPVSSPTPVPSPAAPVGLPSPSPAALSSAAPASSAP